MIQKISIVTPSFNQGEYIEETIDSVLSQNYPNLEYIIIDGGSTDQSVEIIKKHEKHLTYWESKKDSGQSHAINKGLALCTGDIFNWLCSDDLLCNNTLITIGDLFKSGDIDIVMGATESLFSNGTKMRSPQNPLMRNSNETAANRYISQPSTFFKKSIFDELGYLSENLHYLMDNEVWIKYLLKHGQGRVIHTEKALSTYRIHENSKSNLEMDNSRTGFQSKFQIDKNSIAYSIAKQLGFEQQASFIKKLTSNLTSNYQFEFDVHKHLKNCVEYINYYLVDFAQKSFYSGEFKRCNTALKGVIKTELIGKELESYNYLKRKLKLKLIF